MRLIKIAVEFNVDSAISLSYYTFDVLQIKYYISLQYEITEACHLKIIYPYLPTRTNL